MVITNFLQLDFNRVFQEELIDSKFVNFGESLVIAFSRYSKACKNTYISYRSNGRFIFSAGNSRLIAPFCCLIVGDH